MNSFVGIDFGSSYSAVAFTDKKGRPKTLPDSEDPQFRAPLPSMAAVYARLKHAAVQNKNSRIKQ